MYTTAWRTRTGGGVGESLSHSHTLSLSLTVSLTHSLTQVAVDLADESVEKESLWRWIRYTLPQRAFTPTHNVLPLLVLLLNRDIATHAAVLPGAARLSAIRRLSFTPAWIETGGAVWWTE